MEKKSKESGRLQPLRDTKDPSGRDLYVTLPVSFRTHGLLMDSLNRTAILIRIIIALFTRTVFQPDEYFQSLEPAHHLVFGYGHLTWEWMAPQPIRSIIYPAINVPLYYFLKASGLSEIWQLGDLLLVSEHP